MLIYVGGLRAASFDDRVEVLFRPPVAELITLSPDGQRVAYTTHLGGAFAIVTMNVEPPGRKRTVKVEPGDAPFPPDKPPLQLRFLRWATPSRLVFAPTERVIPLLPVTDQNGRSVANPDGPTVVSPIMVMDADGKQRGTLVDARDFLDTPEDARRTLADLLRTTKELVTTRNEPVRWRMPHLDLLGFLPGDREQLVIQTRGGFSRPAQHLIDVRTGSVREFGGDWPLPPGDPLVFDGFRMKVVGERKDAARPTTAWRDEELGAVQRELEVKFPRRVVEILDWSETRARVLFRVTGGSDAGRIFVFQRPENLVLEILRRTPWLNAARLNDSRFFEFDAPDGTHLSGIITWPKNHRFNSPPLLVSFPSGFPGHAQLAFDPEAQIFADMGFVVARLNHRSVAGLNANDLTTLRAAVDRVAVEDARMAIDWIAARMPEHPFDRARVATLGRGFGGYLAVRALQIQPAVFRCGIALDAPMDLRPWLRAHETVGSVPFERVVRDIPIALIDHQDADWKKLSVVEQAEALTKPVFLLVESRHSAAIDASTDALRVRLTALGRSVDYLEIDGGFAKGQATSRATVYRKIGDFLNLHLNEYGVKIGPTKEVE